MTDIRTIYEEMNRIAPFDFQDKGDNSGLLVGNSSAKVTKVLIALDITNDVIDEAADKGAELIISHHPVFNFNYEEFSSIDGNMPIYRLANKSIGAICAHTCLDIADGGINDIIFDMLREPLGLEDGFEVLEKVHADGRGYGKIVTCKEPLEPMKTAEILKAVFRCSVVKFCSGQRPIRRLAFCSGGSGGLVKLAYESGADGYICGDVKHDRWIAARNYGLSVFDCGHFHTENIMVGYLVKRLSATFSDVVFEAAQSGGDPVEYIL